MRLAGRSSLVLSLLLLTIVRARATDPASRCDHALVECLNGGTFPEHRCRDVISAGDSGCTLGSYSRCQCPPTHTGASCQIPITCPADSFLSTSPFTSSVQSYECEFFDAQMALDSFFQRWFFGRTASPVIRPSKILRDHTVHMKSDWDRGTFRWEIRTRPEVQEVSKLFGLFRRAEPRCQPMIMLVSCLATHCSVASDNKVSCNQVSCETASADLPPSLQQFVSGFKTSSSTPISIHFPLPASSTAQVVTVAGTGLSEPLKCMIGSCQQEPLSTIDSFVGITVRSSGWALLTNPVLFLPVFALGILIALVSIVVGVHMEIFSPPQVIVDAVKKYHELQNQDRSSSAVDQIPAQVKEISGSGRISCQLEVKSGSDPIGLAWRNLSYRLPDRITGFKYFDRKVHPGRQILHELSGIVSPGQLVAVIGPSGAGKSTLLDLLGGIRKEGSMTGTVQLTGPNALSRSTRKLLSYVVQTDYNLSVMTVWETLFFSARSRLPSTLSHNEILHRVHLTLDQVGLTHVATSMVGTPEKGGLSGGERRRLSVGVELIADPRVLLLDEITSGLDSYYAISMIRMLRAASRESNMSTLLTIHQPPAQLFDLFDQIIVMGPGGYLVYQGTPQAVLEFMKTQALSSKCAQFLPGCNPFEYLIGTLRSVSDSQQVPISEKKRSLNLASSEFAPVKFKVSDDFDETPGAKLMSEQFEMTSDFRHMMSSIDNSFPNVPAVSACSLALQTCAAPNAELGFVRQFAMLCHRSFRVVARDPSLLILYNCISIIIALLTGLTFQHVDLGISGAHNRIGYIFCSILFGSILSMTSIDLFVSERVLYKREHRSGCYESAPYFLSKLAVDIVPFRIIPAITFTCVSYHMVGFQPDLRHFLIFISTLTLCNAVAGASVFAISNLAGNVRTANLLGVTYFMFNIVFGGPFLSQAGANNSNSPPPTNEIIELLPSSTSVTSSYSSYLSRASFFFYTFEMLAANEFLGLPLRLQPSSIELPDGVQLDTGIEMSGQSFLEMLHWRSDSMIPNVITLIIMLAFLHLSAFAMLRSSKKD